MKCEVEIDVEIPEGYRIKRIGLPRIGETFVETVSPVTLETASINFHTRICIIVEKVAKWRTASPQEILEKLLQPDAHVMRAVGKDIQKIYNITSNFVYIEDTGGFLHQLKHSVIEIRVEVE